MAKFCAKCGSPLTGPFCVKCGADMRQSTTPAPQPPVQQNVGTAAPEAVPAPVAMPATGSAPGQIPVPQPGPVAAQPAATKTGMSPLAKLCIAAVAIIFVGVAAGAVGVYYVAHRVSEKVHEATGGLLGGSESSTRNSRDTAAGASASGGDPCRYLSKQDVGQAIGVEFVGTRIDGESCSYLAKGNQGDMTAKHAAAIMDAKGADAKTQKIFQDFASGIFSSMPQEKQEQGSYASGNVPVIAISVSESPSAVAEMKLNARVLGHLGGSNGPSTGEALDIGDQAFVSSDSAIMIRKGGKLVRIMYMTCPCGTNEVIPLAKKLVQSL
jgi:hypothetical protein